MATRQVQFGLIRSGDVKLDHVGDVKSQAQVLRDLVVKG